MTTCNKPCNPPKTNVNKRWPYVEYYLGERDEENRKNGKGRHHWSGPESLEWYTGNMFHDTMHGDGEYRWRYLGADHLDTTYEGWFYNNSMHGYGLMSYPDGRVFNGLYYKNFRWGPGVESDTCLRENVGLWYGYQLIRLAWRPTVPSVAIDFVLNPLGVNLVARHRILLKTNLKTIGEVNSAIELLKQSGCEPLTAAEKWPKLYAKNCTDLSSQMCHVQAFDRAYYKNGINTLTEATQGPGKDSSQTDNQNDTDRTIYYAWSNNKTIIQMMKHCFTHEEQRGKQQLNIADILSGIRNSFKKPAKHEMDCRSLIMASYLGLISNVATLINECDVNPNVTDVQGNSSVMYAACGDQLDTINFLVEAGAEIDAFNDACCTPLAITLLRYVLEKRGVACNAMLQALLPPPSSPQQPPMPDGNILEWQINRESRETANHLLKQPSKFKVNVVKSKSSFGKMRKTMSKIDYTKPADKKKTAITEPLAQDKQLYETINTQYLIRVAEAFSEPSDVTTIPYIFEVSDMCKDGEAHFEEEAKKVPEKTSKKLIPVKSGLNKPSRDEMFQEKEEKSEEFLDPWKQENLARIMLTILQLLSQGANPRKVRCPQPALFIAAVSGSAELIQHLVRHGADVNEVYPEVFGYSTLDVAVSGPLTNDNLEVIHELLQSGANPDHRLKMPERPDTMSEVEVLGPTLLHVVLTRKIKDGDTHNTADVRNRLLELLLQYGCNPITQFKGQSAVDMALNRGLEFFDIFLRCPRTDLNAVINDSNQTILVKMFCFPFCSTLRLSVRLQMLTNLLLFGADPLIKCRNGQDEYGNLFVFAKSVLSIKQAPSTVKATNAAAKGSKAPKKPEKKNEVKPKKALDAVSRMKTTEDSPGDYRQALDLVVECARLLYIRWLQAQLMKELIEVVNKYKQRHWTMILKEHNNKKCISLWLNVNRGLEIWDTLKTTKKKKYDDEKILKQVLCIIHFYFMRTRILRYPSDTKTWYSTRISFQEKEFIENYVESCKREHTMSDPILMPLTRQYVTPELTVKEVEKFNVCFDCIMPLEAEKILCDSCKLVSFCSFDCMETNINRINCHPCSNYLQEKYFPTPEE